MSKTGNINLVNKLGLNTGNCYSLYAKCVSSDGAKSEDSELLLSSYGITLHNLAGTQSLSDSWMANNESYTITINSLDTSKFRVPTTDTSLWQYNTGGYIKVHRGSTGIFNICTYTLPVGTGYLTFPTDVADGVNNISIEISGAPAEKELRMTGSVTGQFSITCSTQRTSG